MTRSPRVTVLMPVYNAARFLPAAIRSILQQSYSDFEFLIVDDGCTDDSLAVIAQFDDPRIRLVRNGTNQGLVASLNRGVELARGEYIARMDADDISLPDRLMLQVAFMDENLDVAVCGSWLEAFDGSSKTVWSPPVTDQQIKSWLFFESVLYHPTVIMRRRALSEEALRYDPEFPHAEDYELWGRMSTKWRFANIGKVLLQYRLHDESVGRRENERQGLSAGRVRRRLLLWLGMDPTADELQLHDAISVWHIEADDRFLERAHSWLVHLLQANKELNCVSQQEFGKVLAARWYQICFIAAPVGMAAYRRFFRSSLAGYLGVSLRDRLIFALRSFLRRGRS